MPRPARNRRRVSNTGNPAASMEIAQLLALPRQSLVLLASARNLVSTGSKARLAERIHAFEHAIPSPAGPTDVSGPSNVSPPPLSVNVDETPTHRSPSFDRLSQRPSITSMQAYTIPQFRPKVRCFLLRVRNPRLFRRPSKLAP